MNNIKNRLPNLRKNYLEIKELYKKYELEKNEKELNDLGNRLSTYFIDLRFMAMYWNELLDYLGYDPTYIKMFIKFIIQNMILWKISSNLQKCVI